MSYVRAFCLALAVTLAACVAPDNNVFHDTNESAATSERRVEETVAEGLPRGLAMRIDGSGTVHAAMIAWDKAQSRDVVQHLYRPKGAPHFEIEVVATGDRFLEGTGLALDASGAPHVAWFDRGKILLAKKSASGAWTSEIVEPDAGAHLIHADPRVAIDASGTEHVVYNAMALAADGLTRGVPKYAVRKGGAFVTEIIDSGEVYDEGWRVSGVGNAALAVDARGTPHVCYEQSRDLPAITSLSDLKYARRGPNGWTHELVELGGRAGGSCSIAVNANDAPAISHLDWARYDLKYATRGATGWRAALVVDSDGAVGRFSTLAFDAQGSPRIAYIDETTGELKAATGIPGRWKIETILDGHVFSGGDMTAALDPSGRQQFLFTRIGDDKSLVYVR